MKRFLALLLVWTLQPLLAQDRITGRAFATRSEVLARNGMAATSQPLATQAALDILQKGGNAIDAAIAANAVLGLVEPTGNGIGGDLFAMVWSAREKRLYGLNASGRSPKALTLSHLKAQGYQTIPSHGPLPVSVPGCVDGWFELHKRFGSLEMKVILEPAITYAREGFPVSELIAYYWQRSVPLLKQFKNFEKIFTLNGRAPQKGEIFRNPCLAATLEQIAHGGRDAFYKGDIARAIDASMRELGGFLRYEDLATHHSEWVEPVSTTYRGYEVWELPPNGQGIAALQILNILELYDLRAMGFGSADVIHLFAEAKKLAFEDRARFYADPAFHKIPVQELISKAYARKRNRLIDLKRAAPGFSPGNPALEEGDTIYLTVADGAGNMVSLIQSNYRGMGSGCTPDNLGFILQNRGELFSLQEGDFNCYAPGKRPFHTIIPAFITREGQAWVSFGVMGGATQPQAHAQIVINLIDFDMNLQEAGDAPRILHQGSSQPTGQKMRDGGVLCLETGFSYEVIRELMERGHRIQFNHGSYGGYQAIRFDPASRVYSGASESRKDGQAAGY